MELEVGEALEGEAAEAEFVLDVITGFLGDGAVFPDDAVGEARAEDAQGVFENGVAAAGRNIKLGILDAGLISTVGDFLEIGGAGRGGRGGRGGAAVETAEIDIKIFGADGSVHKKAMSPACLLSNPRAIPKWN